MGAAGGDGVEGARRRRAGLAGEVLAPTGAAAAVRTPQPWAPPVEIALKVPPNGVACPKKLSPQQAAVPFALNPQLWESPAAIAMKAPPAGADWP